MRSVKLYNSSDRVRAKLKCSLNDSSYILKKLVTLLSDEVANQMVDRHCQLISNYLQNSRDGLMLKDLSLITIVLIFLSEHVGENLKYKRPLKDLLQFCGTPPLIERSSDCLKYMDDLLNYFSVLGYLICCTQQQKVQLMVINILLSLLTQPHSYNLPSVKLPFCYKAAEQSDLPKTLGQLLEFVSWPVYLLLLDLAVVLANISAKTSVAMVHAGVIDAIFLRLDTNYLSRGTVFPTELPEDLFKLELTHNEYESMYASLNALLSLLHFLNVPEETAPALETYFLSKRSLWSLRYLMPLVMLKNNVEMRNDVLCLILLTLTVFPNTYIIESGLADDVAMLSVATELGTDGTWTANLTFRSSQEDFLFKKILLLINCYVKNYAGAAQVFKRQKVVKGLLHLTDQHFTTKLWTPLQLWELIKFAVKSLSLIVPLVHDDFAQENGPRRLLTLIRMYMQMEFDINILLNSWRTIALAITAGNKELHSELQDEPSFYCIFTLCNYLLTKPCVTLKYQRILTYIFYSLEQLTRNQTVLQTLCGYNAICLVQGLFHRVLHSNSTDAPFCKRLLISAIDFLWECIVWNPHNIVTFVQQGGTYIILDIVQRYTFPVKIISLAVLVDLVDQGSCITHILTWRTGAINYMQMLLDIWREEEKHLKCLRTIHGAIIELEYPLMGEQQKELLKTKNTSISPAMSDVIGSARPKIYAIIQIITQQYSEKMNFILDKYCMRHLTLTTEAQITLLVAKNYFALKMAEVWGEVVQQLQQLDVELVKTDGEALDLLKCHYINWARSIQEYQNQLITQHIEEGKHKEIELYTDLRESKLSDTLDALKELDHIAQTSDKQFQKAHKQKQIQLIDECLYLLGGSFKTNIHRTFMEETAITVKGDLIMLMQGDCGKYMPYDAVPESVSKEDTTEGPECCLDLTVLPSYSEFQAE